MSAVARAAVPVRDVPARGAVRAPEPTRNPRPVPPRPGLRVVPPASFAAPRAPFVALVLGLLVAGLVSLLTLNTLVNENSFRIHALQEQQQAQELREQQLQREIDAKEATPALAAAARRIGLVPAGTPAFIKLPDGQVLGVPTAAKATPLPEAAKR